VTQNHPRPAWLIGLLAAASAATVVGAAGCARLSGELVQGRPLADAFRGTHSSPASSVGETQLTSAVMPRLSFASPDTPVDQLLKEGDRPLPMNGLCPADMASIDDRFCVDKYEASLVEVLPSGREQAWPYYLPVEGHTVRAVSERGVYPQGYISGKQAAAACKASGKRLCKPREWKTACKGPDKQQFGYGQKRQPGTCNDQGRSGMGLLHGREIAQGKGFVWNNMNDPQLNQLPGTLAETGSHEGCTNGYGVYDMVGNIHEWVDDPAGTFQGGYYLDVEQNGDGCGYRTDAHEFAYHDYSTGFRCCADVAQ
jgi:sulfatase modifying factor 1